MYSRRNESFGMIHHFWSCGSEQCNMITPLGFATGPSLNQAERLPIKSNQAENTYGWQQIFSGQYIKICVNGASTICGDVHMVIHSDLAIDIHNGRIGSFYWQKRQQHGHCPILRMCVNGVSTIFSFASRASYIPIGCRHPFMRYWQPLMAKTTATCSLRHPENERQWSVNDF